ncbi:MAG TPA: retroviral-like aspartic protease family protein [Burkholderiaceae bacterium]
MKLPHFIALLGLLAAYTVNAAPAQCNYQLLVSFPVKFQDLTLSVEGSINGNSADMIVDTGADLGTLTRDAANRLGLKLIPLSGHSYGFGGEAKTYKTMVDEIVLGPWKFQKQVMMVSDDVLPHHDALIGAKFLLQSDLEMSMRTQELKMFRPENCKDAFLAYWDANAQDIPLEKAPVGDPRPVVMVELNGKKLRALVDSGMQVSAINLAAAAKLGVTPQTEGVVEEGHVAGLGKQEVKRWRAKFQSFAIGGETIKNPQITMFDMFGAAKSDSDRTGDIIFDDEEADMVLGADFLRAHHVLFAVSQRRFYFSYLGGNVFDLSAMGVPSADPMATH